MKSYNGFSGPYRAKVGKCLKEKIEPSRWPTSCEMCDRRSVPIQLHLEDYDKPDSWVGLCIRCHMSLHNRDHNLNHWNLLVSKIDAEMDGRASRVVHKMAATTPAEYRTDPPLNLVSVRPSSPHPLERRR